MPDSPSVPLVLDALVLCGGRSRRFGGDKARAVVGDRTLIELVVAALRPVSRRITLVADRHERFRDLGLPVLEDETPYRGPLHALARALPRIDGEAAFVASCDMPFLVPDLFTLEAQRLGDADACVPWDGERYAPLAALYRKRAAVSAQRLVAAGGERLMDLIAELRIARLDLDDAPGLPRDVLQNVNTQADVEAARTMASTIP